jgi:hypothetical protein
VIRRTRPAAPYSAQQTASVLDFISDPSLLRSSFEGPSWDRWRAVLRAAFALPMSRHDRELFAEVAGDRAPPKRRVKELVAAVGRGGGKDSIAAALATFIATTGDFTRLRPGEKATVMTLATDRDQAGIAFSYIRAHLEETPLLAPLIHKVDSDRIALRNGAEILVQTNNIRAPRGRTIARAIYYEAAHWLGEDYANPDVEVDNAVTPGLMRFPGGLKIIISSVHRRSGPLTGTPSSSARTMTTFWWCSEPAYSSLRRLMQARSIRDLPQRGRPVHRWPCQTARQPAPGSPAHFAGAPRCPQQRSRYG